MEGGPGAQPPLLTVIRVISILPSKFSLIFPPVHGFRQYYRNPCTSVPRENRARISVGMSWFSGNPNPFYMPYRRRHGHRLSRSFRRKFSSRRGPHRVSRRLRQRNRPRNIRSRRVQASDAKGKPLSIQHVMRSGQPFIFSSYIPPTATALIAYGPTSSQAYSSTNSVNANDTYNIVPSGAGSYEPIGWDEYKSWYNRTRVLGSTLTLSLTASPSLNAISHNLRPCYLIWWLSVSGGSVPAYPTSVPATLDTMVEKDGIFNMVKLAGPVYTNWDTGKGVIYTTPTWTQNVVMKYHGPKEPILAMCDEADLWQSTAAAPNTKVVFNWIYFTEDMQVFPSQYVGASVSLPITVEAKFDFVCEGDYIVEPVS